MLLMIVVVSVAGLISQILMYRQMQRDRSQEVKLYLMTQACAAAEGGKDKLADATNMYKTVATHLAIYAPKDVDLIKEMAKQFAMSKKPVQRAMSEQHKAILAARRG